MRAREKPKKLVIKQMMSLSKKTFHNSRKKPRDFSLVEDSSRAYTTIQRLDAEAGKVTADQARASGLSRIFVRYNQQFRVTAAGDETVIKVKLPKTNSLFIKFHPSTILHAT